jgi:hypothetical protein
MWYELQPLSVAVGWGVFGIVLFEYGLLRNTRQFRFQAYVVLAAAFGRIFFANLTAGNPAEFWGPRMYTVLPLTLMFFFVYAQLGSDEARIRDDRRLHFDDLLGYVGTGSIVALLYCIRSANTRLTSGGEASLEIVRTVSASGSKQWV